MPAERVSLRSWRDRAIFAAYDPVGPFRSLPSGNVRAKPSRDTSRARAARFWQKFLAFAQVFFARVVDQTFQYYLSRELSNHVGPGQRFASDADRQSFDRALTQHSYEAARIEESYAGGWYGKAVWQGEGLTRDSIRRFTAYSMTKLRGELERSDDAA